MKERERMERVARLVSELLDGVLDATGREELNERLRGDPEACELYLDRSEIHAALLREGAASAPVAGEGAAPPFAGSSLPFPLTESAEADPQARPGPRRSLRPGGAFGLGLAAAAALALLLHAGARWADRDAGRGGGFLSAPAPEAPETSEAGVAVLSRLVDPEWAEGAGPVEGAPLEAGAFRLRSGLAQLEFFSGATVVVEGPADLELESAWRVLCRQGRLRASVPEPARGFTVVTPDYEAVDLGTEFSLGVGGDGRSEIHVLEGEVRLDGDSGLELGRLRDGEGMRSTGEALEPVRGAGGDFVDGRRLLDLAEADRESRYESWRSARSLLSGDPDCLVYFDFEDQPPWERHLPNRAAGAQGGGGAVVGAQWTQGRWPGKGALEFKRISDRVRLAVPGEFEALTLAAWVRIEGFDRWLSSLLLTDGFETGEVHWQISDRGELVLGISDAEPFNSFSPEVIEPRSLGRWLHLAVTVDRASRTVVHYLDGEAVSEHRLEEVPPLRLGPAEIGNWQSLGKGHPIRSLNGRVDEFAVLARALSPGELRSLRDKGAPGW